MKSIVDEISKNWAVVSDDACRLFHGRGHCFDVFEWLNIDWFRPVVWITVYRAPGEAGEQLFKRLTEIFDDSVETIAVQHRYQKGAPVNCLRGVLPETHFATEGDLKFHLQLGGKQNIGFFLDMKPGRNWLAHQSNGRKVLNLFSYTCAFSVVAIHAGAKSVVNIDMAKAALEVGKNNHRLNEQDLRMQSDVRMLPYDIFRSLKRLISWGPYDTIICDPPSRQKGSFEADRHYVKILNKLPQLLATGGDILLCLNAPYYGPNFLTDLVAEHCSGLKLVERLATREDFPEAQPDRNLKLLHYRWETSF